MLNRSIACLTLVAAGAVALAGLGASLVDNFRTRTPSDLWFVLEQGASVRQGGGQLAFSVPRSTDLSFSGYYSRTTNLDLNAGWSASFKYGLVQGPIPQGGVSAALLLMNFFDAEYLEQEVVAPCVYRSSNGTFLGMLSLDDVGYPVIETICQVPARGTLGVSYLPGGERLIVSIDGRTRHSIRWFASSLPSRRTTLWGIGSAAWGTSTPFTYRQGVTIGGVSVQGPGLVEEPSPFVFD